jgi:uncharacterized protein (TIGR02265 family)
MLLAEASGPRSPRFEQTSRFGHEVDLEGSLRACPREATTLGTFFQHVFSATLAAAPKGRERLLDGLGQCAWFPFKSYPLTDFMRLAYNAAAVSFAHLPSAEGLRRIGWMSYPSFASTMAGRVVLFALGKQLEDVVRACPHAYRHSLSLSQVQVTERSKRLFEIEMHGVYSFVDTYHCGVLEGAVLAFQRAPRVTVEPLRRRCDARFVLGWD